MRIVRCASWVAAGLLIAGCQATPKPPPPGPSGQPFWENSPSPGPTAATGQRRGTDPSEAPLAPGGAEVSGVLAGQLLEPGNRRPGKTMIRVVALPGPAGGAAKAREVSADEQGYFVIRGLEPDQTYILTASTRDGDQILGGEVQARPPYTRLLIRLREGFTPSTPAGPAESTGIGGAWGTGGPSAPKPGPPGSPPVPAPAIPKPPDPGPPPRAGGPTDPSKIATGPEKSPKPPVVSVPGPPGFSPPPPNVLPPEPPVRPVPPAPPEAPPEPLTAVPAAPAKVPSCSISADATGIRVDNFALPEPNGRGWEFRRDRSGKLALLVFWCTSCQPCLKETTYLRALQTAYGPYGLEVIGIACEREPADRRAARVAQVAKELQLNYRVLLAGDRDTCPVQDKFRIQVYPTIYLIDDHGKVVWYRQGSGNLPKAEETIRRILDTP